MLRRPIESAGESGSFHLPHPKTALKARSRIWCISLVCLQVQAVPEDPPELM